MLARIVAHLLPLWVALWARVYPDSKQILYESLQPELGMDGQAILLGDVLAYIVRLPMIAREQAKAERDNPTKAAVAPIVPDELVPTQQNNEQFAPASDRLETKPNATVGRPRPRYQLTLSEDLSRQLREMADQQHATATEHMRTTIKLLVRARQAGGFVLPDDVTTPPTSPSRGDRQFGRR